MGMTPEQMYVQPRYYLEEILGEVAPSLFPEDFENMNTEDLINIKRGVQMLPDKGTAAAVMAGKEEQPTQARPEPKKAIEAPGSSLTAPLDLGGGQSPKFLNAPKQLTGGTKRTAPRID